MSPHTAMTREKDTPPSSIEEYQRRIAAALGAYMKGRKPTKRKRGGRPGGRLP